MKKTTIFLIGCFFSLAISLPLCAQAGRRMVFVVRKGDTLGQIVFLLRAEGINVYKLHEWNPRLGTQVQAGEKIFYFAPKKPLPPVSQKQIREIAAKVTKDIGAKVVQQERADVRRAVLWAVVGCLALFLMAVVGKTLYGARARRASKGQRASTPTKPAQTGILTNPTIQELRTIAETNGIFRIPFVRKIKEGSVEWVAIFEPSSATPIGKQTPKVWRPGEKNRQGNEKLRRWDRVTQNTAELLVAPDTIRGEAKGQGQGPLIQ